MKIDFSKRYEFNYDVAYYLPWMPGHYVASAKQDSSILVVHPIVEGHSELVGSQLLVRIAQETEAIILKMMYCPLP